jgi:predicted small lipoprotein YifL
MKKTTVFFLAVLAATAVAGCGQREPDCENPRTQKEQEQCAHKESTEPRGPDSLPANPKKW